MRKMEITEEVIKRIAQYIRIGSYRSVAALAAGVNRASLYNWIRRGRDLQQAGHTAKSRLPKGDRMCIRLCEEMDRAAAAAECHDLQAIEDATGRDWRAAAWRLRARYPRRWGDAVTLMRGDNGASIAIPEAALNDPQIRAIADDLAYRMAELTRDDRGDTHSRGSGAVDSSETPTPAIPDAGGDDPAR